MMKSTEFNSGLYFLHKTWVDFKKQVSDNASPLLKMLPELPIILEYYPSCLPWPTRSYVITPGPTLDLIPFCILTSFLNSSHISLFLEHGLICSHHKGYVLPGSSAWNILPPDVHMAGSTSSFRKQMTLPLFKEIFSNHSPITGSHTFFYLLPSKLLSLSEIIFL